MRNEHLPARRRLPEQLKELSRYTLEAAGDVAPPGGAPQQVRAVRATRRHRRVNHRRRWLFRGVDQYRRHSKMASKTRNGSLDVRK
ncbi:MAG: hypothetical protein J7M14_03595 [Planctomycetes bacterium]|nr:hypothetical protein [Planctomycetota bacterium]